MKRQPQYDAVARRVAQVAHPDHVIARCKSKSGQLLGHYVLAVVDEHIYLVWVDVTGQHAAQLCESEAEALAQCDRELDTPICDWVRCPDADAVLLSEAP